MKRWTRLSAKTAVRSTRHEATIGGTETVRFCPNAVAAWLREHGGWAQILPSFRIAGSVSAGPLSPFQDGPVRMADLFISGSCVLRAVDLLTAEGETLIYNAVATGAAQCGPGGAGPRFHCS